RPASSAGTRGLAGCGLAGGRTARARGSVRLTGQCAVARGGVGFAFERLTRRAASPGRRLPIRFSAPTRAVTSRTLAGALGGTARFGRRQCDAGTAGLGQADCDGLFGRARAVLAFAHVLDFLAHELAGLGARSFALGLVFRRASFGIFLGHVWSLVLAVGAAVCRVRAKPQWA